MKKDAVTNAIDLDQMFNSKAQATPTQTLIEVEGPKKPSISIDYDDILSEWCYRLPKGYPTVSNGQFNDPTELAILKEVLQEYGVDDIDVSSMPIAVTRRSENKVLEAEQQFSKEDLIRLINSTELSEKDLVRVMRIVDATGSESGIVELLQAQKNFDKSTSNQIFRMATETDSYKRLSELLKNPNQQIDVDSLGIRGSLFEKGKQLGLTLEFLKDLSDYIPYTSVKMGRYEMFLRLLLKGGRTPTRKGDVEVDGKEMEVKSTVVRGSGFRLRGQSGYGSGKRVQEEFSKLLTAQYKKGKIDTIPQQILDLRKAQANQMWYLTKESWAVVASKDLVAKKLAQKSDIINMWATALSYLYPAQGAEEIVSFISPAFGNDGDLDMKQIMPRLAALEFTIYRRKEAFDYFIAVNFKNEYGLISNDLQGEDLVKIFSSTFRISSIPNTKDNATSQDSMTAVELD